MNGISIIICCYNSASRLEKTIQHIALQKQVSFSFEVVLVDNNSTDKTSVIAKELFLRYNIANYQIVFESTTGLIYARKCGVLNTKHDILVFCDDDNWLEVNYLFNVALGFKTYPDAGILGSWSEAVFDENQIVPIWFNSVKECFAVIDKPSFDTECYFVVGAGMAIRKKVTEVIFNEEFQSVGRKGTLLLSGEDNEICEKTIKLGYKVYQLKNLKLKHYLPPKRLTWSYVTRLNKGHGIYHMQKIYADYKKEFWRLYLANVLLAISLVVNNPKAFYYFVFRFEGKLEASIFHVRYGYFQFLNDLIKKNIE